MNADALRHTQMGNLYLESQRLDSALVCYQKALEQDSTTNLANNEYVLFKDSGVYMQVVERGTG